MASKSQKAGSSLTVSQYSQVVLSKYIKEEFSPDPVQNRRAAADELYVLQRKLLDATARDSEDSKAPLKAIRNAIESHAFNSPEGADSPQVDSLVQLYAQLEALCQERIAAGGREGEAAARVQDALRYRMTRLVTADSWDARPQLKMRVLKLMFSFMVGENRRMMAEARRGAAGSLSGGSGDTPPIRLSRQSSFNRKSLSATPCSKWQDAINEMSKMQGSRMLPLLKLSLLENLDLAAAAAASTAGTAAPTPPSATGSVSGSPRQQLGQSPATEGAAAAAIPIPKAGAVTGQGKQHVAAPATKAAAAAGSSSDGSETSTAGTSGASGAASGGRAALMAPATPARPGASLGEAPSRARLYQVQQGQQAQQRAVHAAADLDDLLGLSDAPLPQEEHAQHSPSLPMGDPTELFAAFDHISPPTGASLAPAATGGSLSGNPYAPYPRTAVPAGSQPTGMYQPQPQAQHPAGSAFPHTTGGTFQGPSATPMSPTSELVRSQFSGMSMGSSMHPGPQAPSASPYPQSPYMQAMGSGPGGMQYNSFHSSYGSLPPSTTWTAGGQGPVGAVSFLRDVPPPISATGSGSSAPGGSGGSGIGYTGGWQAEGPEGMMLFRHNSFPSQPEPDITAPARSVGDSDTALAPSPYQGKPNPFGDTRFAELAPHMQALRPSPPPQPPAPAGPPMRSQSNK